MSRPLYVDPYLEGSCVYRLDKNGDDLELVAWARNSGYARLVLDALRRDHPDDRFEQRRRARIESES